MVTTADKANIESLTATWEPRMRAAFLQAVASVTTTVDIVALTALIEAGDVLGAMAAVGADTAHFSALALTQTSLFNEGGMALARAATKQTTAIMSRAVRASLTSTAVRLPSGKVEIPKTLKAAEVARQKSVESFSNATPHDLPSSLSETLKPAETIRRGIVPSQSPANFQLLFDVRAPRAEQWIRQRSSTLIQEITADQRTTIRNHLEAGLRAGENPRTTALDLVGRIDPRTKQRVGGVIGLHSTQEEWLRTYSADLASSDPARLRRLLERGLRDKRFDATVLKAIRDGTPIPAETQAKMRAAYANRALKWRADNIARTETIRSLGQAQTEMWQQNIDRGKVDVALLTRFWVTAGDERVRATHRLIPGMNKEGRKWGEPFDTPTGPQMHAPSTEPQCRCHEKVSMDFLAQAIARKKARDEGSGGGGTAM